MYCLPTKAVATSVPPSSPFFEGLPVCPDLSADSQVIAFGVPLIREIVKSFVIFFSLPCIRALTLFPLRQPPAAEVGCQSISPFFWACFSAIVALIQHPRHMRDTIVLVRHPHPPLSLRRLARRAHAPQSRHQTADSSRRLRPLLSSFLLMGSVSPTWLVVKPRDTVAPFFGSGYLLPGMDNNRFLTL